MIGAAQEGVTWLWGVGAGNGLPGGPSCFFFFFFLERADEGRVRALFPRLLAPPVLPPHVLPHNPDQRGLLQAKVDT